MHTRPRRLLGAAALLLACLPLAAHPPALAREAPTPLATATVEMETLNPGAVLERDLCLSIALGPAAAAECGALRIAHPLPTVRTLNRARTPVLLYNSEHAHPHPLVAAHVTLPADADSVQAVLRVDGRERARRSWTGPWPASATKRIVLGFDAGEDPTGIYADTLTVTAFAGGVASSTGTAAGERVVVNRRQSPFGAGWWLAGLEELVVDGCGKPMYWVGGDGSVRRYTATDCTKGWAAPSLDRPDSLKWNAGIGLYERILPGGVRVQFNAQGRHVATVDRLGHATRFGYQRGRLTSISTPPEGRGRSYELRYGPEGRLREVVAPGVGTSVRTTRLVRSAGTLTVTGPDGHPVRYEHTAAVRPERITARVDRRGTRTRYGFDAAGRVNGSTVEMQGTGEDVVRTLRPLESLGMDTPVDTARAYARYDGPRTDVADTTAFWLDGRGAPRRIVDALGNETVLKRENAAYPALVTEVRAPNGLLTRAWYDARGNVDSTTVVNPYGDGRDATTRYAWDPAWDFVTRITRPEGEVTQFAYEPGTGNRLWVKPSGDDARADTVRFRYYASGTERGLLRAVAPPLSPPDSLAYDPRGNLARTWTALGLRTESHGDDLGRDTLSVGPDGSTQRTWYDAQDRVLRTTSEGAPSYRTLNQRVTVQTVYDEEGNVLSVSRTMSPDPNRIGEAVTRWRYDPAGRKVAEVHPDGRSDSTTYNAAGLPVEYYSRRRDSFGGLVVAMDYDPLGRLLERQTHPVRYPTETRDEFGRKWVFPQAPLDPDNPDEPGRIPGDTARFAYDAMGNLRSATNRDARISRTYYPGGAPESETQKIRTYVGTDTTSHVYTLRYAYDRNGRRTRLRYPDVLAPVVDSVVRNEVQYAYDPHTGRLDSVVDLAGNVFRYRYDREGRPEHLTLPGGMAKAWGYDPDGRLMRAVLADESSGGTLLQDSLVYDARGKIIEAHGSMGRADADYAALGALTHWRSGPMYNEQWLTVDPLGNVASEDRRWVNLWVEPPKLRLYQEHSYEPRTGRLTRSVGYNYPGGRMVFDNFTGYDESGNKVGYLGAEVAGENILQEHARYYYDAQDRLVAVDRQRCLTDLLYSSNATRTALCVAWEDHRNLEAGAFEEYRYDALGRRVLVRSRPDPQCTSCTAHVQRTVWDGDQILGEIRAPGADNEQSLWEADDWSGEEHGQVAYTHGPGLDAPLSLVRKGHPIFGTETILPFENWRGAYVGGSFADGTAQRCDGPLCIHLDEIPWPGQNLSAFLQTVDPRETPPWFGSLITNQKDASGQFYRRNRYYDPNSGRFTQEDPIGLAGGLNLYGFANGDPVSYSDPYGLSPCYIWSDRDSPECIEARENPERLTGAPPFITPGGVGGLARAGQAIVGGVRAFGIMRQARTIVGASEMATLRAAARAGTSAEVQIAGRTIVYEPGLSASGMTLFGENGFVLGRHAFSSSAELTKTILHELHRLSTSGAASGLSGAAATAETGAAFTFAEKAYRAGRWLKFW